MGSYLRPARVDRWSHLTLAALSSESRLLRKRASLSVLISFISGIFRARCEFVIETGGTFSWMSWGGKGSEIPKDRLFRFKAIPEKKVQGKRFYRDGFDVLLSQRSLIKVCVNGARCWSYEHQLCTCVQRTTKPRKHSKKFFSFEEFKKLCSQKLASEHLLIQRVSWRLSS